MKPYCVYVQPDRRFDNAPWPTPLIYASCDTPEEAGLIAAEILRSNAFGTVLLSALKLHGKSSPTSHHE